jgi:formylmethanofuran dehydrogenase subunit A
VAPAYDAGIEADIREHFRKNYTVSFDNFSVHADHFPHREMVCCR